MGGCCLSVCLCLTGWLVSLSACLVVVVFGFLLECIVCFRLPVRKCQHSERQVSRVQV